jgi:hypothetical protein
MRRATAFIATTLLVAAGVVAAVGAFNAWIDPFIQYRIPSYKPRYVTGFARQINAGLARNLEYDSVVVGSSYAMNFRNSDFDRAFGGRTASLVMPGMFVSEARKVLSYAASLRLLKRVYFGIDYFAFVEGDNRYQFPDYLYDSSWLNDGPYLFSIDTSKRSFYIALGRGPANFNTDSDMPWSWAKEGSRFGRERALSDYTKRSGRAEPARRYRLDEMESAAREQIEPLLRENGYTEFEFFLSPYSALTWLLFAEQGNIAPILRFRIYLAELITKYPTAHLHDFQAFEGLICDLDNYTDVGHYGPDVNRMMVSAMRSGRYLATPDDVRANNSVIEAVVSGRCAGSIAMP